MTTHDHTPTLAELRSIFFSLTSPIVLSFSPHATNAISSILPLLCGSFRAFDKIVPGAQKVLVVQVVYGVLSVATIFHFLRKKKVKSSHRHACQPFSRRSFHRSSVRHGISGETSQADIPRNRSRSSMWCREFFRSPWETFRHRVRVCQKASRLYKRAEFHSWQSEVPSEQFCFVAKMKKRKTERSDKKADLRNSEAVVLQLDRFRRPRSRGFVE